MSCPDIIVIEDDIDIRETVVDILQMEGFQVAQFENGKAAMEGLKECGKPCLIFLDLMMPEMNGIQFLEARKALKDQVVNIPIVVVSATAEQARGRADVKGILRKPIDIDSLLAAAHKYCTCVGNKPKVA